MRCGLRWDGIARIACYALLPVVLISAAPTTVFGRPSAQRASLRAAEELVCHSIRRSESATQVARRITGDERNAYQPWFEIRNASSRFVPKSQYDRIRAGWQACVSKRALRLAAVKPIPIKAADAADASESSATIAASEAVAVPAALTTTEGLEDAVDSSPPIALQVVRSIRSVDLIMLWLGAALVVPWFGWRIADNYLARRKIASVVMRHFADRFVFEFERPLVRYGVEKHALRSRLRFRARPGRFDILLAPRDGRRYPNLSDHKKNVEYDVARVLRVLGDRSFKYGPLSMDAEWVVVPFQFKAGPKQAGVTCISSF